MRESFVSTGRSSATKWSWPTEPKVALEKEKATSEEGYFIFAPVERVTFVRSDHIFDRDPPAA